MKILNVEFNTHFLSESESINYFNEIKKYFKPLDFTLYYKSFTRQVCSECRADVSVKSWTPTLVKLKNVVERYTGWGIECAIVECYGDEKCILKQLRTDSESATVIFGASKILRFIHQDGEVVDLQLLNGSLLVMNAVKEPSWTHSISSEFTSAETITVTFHKMTSTDVECIATHPPSKRLHDECNELVSKKHCCEEEFENSATEQFFTTLPSNLLDTTHDFDIYNQFTDLSESEHKNNSHKKTVMQTSLGMNAFLSVVLIKKQILINIYEHCEELIKNNCAMDLETWYELQFKLQSFNLCYTSASFVANNAVLVLNINHSMHIQPLNVDTAEKSTSIQLCGGQMDTLIKSLENINNTIIEFLLTEHFSFHVKCKIKLFCELSSDEEDVLLSKFVTCIEQELVGVLQKTYHCNGCIIEHGSQHQHPCITISNFDKYLSLGSNIILLLDIEALALRFIESANSISESFLNNICVDTVKDVIYAMHIVK